MKKKDDKALSKRDLGFQTTITPPKQDREQTAVTCEQESQVKEVHIKSEPNLEPFSEDLWDVLDELGELLDAEQADSAFELHPEITPPPPSFCLEDDTSLFTRRSDNDRFTINIDESLETSCKSKNSKKKEFSLNGTTQIFQLHDSKSHNLTRSSTANAVHERTPTARRSSSKESKSNRAIESNPKSPRPTSNERRSAHRKSKTHSLSSAGHKLRSDDNISISDKQKNSKSQSKLGTNPGKSRDCRRSISHNPKYCMADQKRHPSKSSDRVKERARRSQSKLRNSPIRTRNWRRSVSQSSKYCTEDQKRHRSKSSDRVKDRTRRSPSKLRNSPIRSRNWRRSISQKSIYCKAVQHRHRSKSRDRLGVRNRRRSSPRERLDRRAKSRGRSRSPHNTSRSDYISYPRPERSCAERIHRRRNNSSSPRRSHDFRRQHISRYSPLRMHRQRSRSRSNSRKFSRCRRSRSRSPVRNACNNRSNQAKILIRGRSGSTERSRSRSLSSTAPLRKRSNSIDRPSNAMNNARPGSRAPRLRIQHTSRKKSPSAQSPPLLDETMKAVQASQAEKKLQPMTSSIPVNISPRPIAPMITLHENRVSRPTSLRRQLLPTPTAPHMFYMQTHFANIEYRTALSYQPVGPPYNPAPVNLAPFDLRHRLDTSRSLNHIGPNDLRHRIQDLCAQNTYLPPPAFNAHAQWPPGYTTDYNGYY